MYLNFGEPLLTSNQKFASPALKPGEIWELNRCVRSPLEFSNQQQRQLYSVPAQKFLEGKFPPRYVMIVNEPEPPIDRKETWSVVCVMLLSVETRFLSDANLLIPKELSSLENDLLAQTLHVLPMLACNLLQPVGRRLSRQIYDLLLNVGDYHYGLIDEAPSQQEIQALGLRSATVCVKQQAEIEEFYRQEEAWSDVLSVPLAAYYTYLKAIKLTDAVLDEALNLERELASELIAASVESQSVSANAENSIQEAGR